MKAKISVEKLSDVLGRIRRVPSDKPTIPETAGILLEFHADNTLNISANSTSQWALITLSEGVQVETPGSVVMPAKRFIGWVKTFKSGMVSLGIDSKKKDTAVLSVGKARTKIKCYSVGEFHEVPTKSVGDEDITFQAEAEDFRQKVESVRWSFNTDRDTLPRNKSVNILCRADGTVQLRAYDGLGSLSFVNLAIENPVPRPEDFDVFVPGDLLDALSFEDGELSVAVTRDKIGFVQEGFMGGGSLVEGQFPNPSSLLSGLDELPQVRLPVDAFKSAVSRLDIVLTDAISCLFDMAQTEFILRSRSGSSSSVSEAIPVNTEGFEPDQQSRIALSLPYIKALLSHYSGGEFIFKFNQRMAIFYDPGVSDDWVGLMAQMVLSGGE